MADLFKPTFKDHRTGQTRQSRFWYARIRGKRVPLKVTDRRIAERKAQEIERQLELGNDPALLVRQGDRVRQGARSDKGGLRIEMALADEQTFAHSGTLQFLDNQLDPATGTDPSVRIVARNLSVQHETWPKLKYGDLDTQVAIVGWDQRVHRKGASYGFDFAAPRPLPVGAAIVFSAADAGESTLPEDFKPPKGAKAPPKDRSGLDWTVVLTDGEGRPKKLTLADYY